MRTNVKFLVKLFSKSLQGVGQRPTTLTLVGGSQRETRETAKRFSRTAAQLPSQSRLPPCQHLAAGSGAVCQWQTSRTDRRGSGDRLLGNVPLGRNSPFSKGPASAAVCTQAGLFFRLHVHIQLGVGDGDALPIEGGLHVLLHLIIDGPVVVRVAPDLAH